MQGECFGVVIASFEHMYNPQQTFNGSKSTI